MLSYQQAREMVISRLAALRREPRTEFIPLLAAQGRILGQDILSDRDYPPFDRSIRDGYAVRAADTHSGATLRCIGELKAGDTPSTTIQPGTCIQIMTGAALASGADAVIMIEHTQRNADMVTLDRAVQPGQHVVPRGSEQPANKTVLTKGTRLGFAQIAAAAQVGAAQLTVHRKPRITILSTGDEVVDFTATPGPFQIRNSNSASLAAQVAALHAEPVPLGNAKDTHQDLRAKIATGLQTDALILSGGVSAGKYDLVEPVLREFGAEFVFAAVAIRPGKPVVFALCQGKPVFGLPGNPVSTMVTFELFARLAIELLSGTEPTPLPCLEAILTERMQEKPGLTHFLPALLECGGPAAALPSSGLPTADQREPSSRQASVQVGDPQPPRVTPLPWQGSGDITAMSRANCLLVIPPDRETIKAGERVQVILRGL
jgi:molybdopterin molybdotransferase